MLEIISLYWKGVKDDLSPWYMRYSFIMCFWCKNCDKITAFMDFINWQMHAETTSTCNHRWIKKHILTYIINTACTVIYTHMPTHPTQAHSKAHAIQSHVTPVTNICTCIMHTFVVSYRHGHKGTQCCIIHIMDFFVAHSATAGLIL